jgi:HEPN domain-containing protein
VKKIPNTKVWILGREYLEAAESLVEETKLWPAAVLAALSVEIFLKSFLVVQEDEHGYPSTQRGHPLTDLFSKIDAADQTEIIRCSSQLDSTYNVRASLAEFNDIFTAARYQYEKEAVKSVRNDIVIFARHLCDAILELGKSRGV